MSLFRAKVWSWSVQWCVSDHNLPYLVFVLHFFYLLSMGVTLNMGVYLQLLGHILAVYSGMGIYLNIGIKLVIYSIIKSGLDSAPAEVKMWQGSNQYDRPSWFTSPKFEKMFERYSFVKSILLKINEYSWDGIKKRKDETHPFNSTLLVYHGSAPQFPITKCSRASDSVLFR